MRTSCSRLLNGVLIVAAVVAPLLAQDRPKLSFDQAIGVAPAPSFAGRLSGARWAADGVHVVVKEGGKTLWLDPATGKTGEPGTDAAPAPASRPEASDRLLAERSADGKLEAYIRENNLILAGPDGKDVPVTTDGGPAVFNGYLDWVYQEEVYGRGKFKAFWWSPDSTRLTFLRLDEAEVKDFTVVDHVPASLDTDRTVKLETTKYPKAGDPNPTAKLGIYDVASKKTIWADLSAYEPDILLVRVGWTPDGKRALVQIQNRIQTWLDLASVDPESGAVKALFRETSKSWVEVIEEPQWLQDGSFLWQSDRTGFRHLYHYDADGTLRTTITKGEWAVKDVVRVDEKKAMIFFTSTKDGAVDSNLYRVPLAGGDVVRMTQGRGSHRTTLNGDGTYFLDTVSSVSAPPEQRLCRDDGSVVKVLAKATVPGIEQSAFATTELVEIPTRDGVMLDAVVTKPPDMDKDAKHAIWIDTYSGPDTPSVTNRWGPSPWEQFLAQQGYIVFQVNVRSASGKGQSYTASCYKQFGIQELQDLEDAIAWLCKNPWADAKRVGITGWSYGGFMTAFALTHSEAFALGIAGAGVYDWRLYDTIYTERYMDRPQANKEGYEKTSCLNAAKNLKGHLVLLHGTMDDNVHLQNTIRFVYELERRGKDFEMMLYPKSRHGVGSQAQYQHMHRLMWRAIQEHLGGPKKG